MPYLTFAQNDFKNVVIPGEDAPVATATVQLSGRQKALRITGAALLSFCQGGTTNATVAPFNFKFAKPGESESYYADTRCKDTFDITIPFSGRNQIAITAVWKGGYTYYPVEQVFSFGLNVPMEISIHEILE